MSARSWVVVDVAGWLIVAVCSNLEGSHTVVSDQGVRKTLYQKVCAVLSLLLRIPTDTVYSLRSSLRSRTGGSHPAKYPEKVRVPPGYQLFVSRLTLPSSLPSERDEEEVRERVDGPGLSAASRTLLLLLCCPPPSLCTLPAYHYPSSPSLGPYPLRAASRVLIVLSVIRVSPTLPYQYIWLVCYSTVRV